MKAKWKNIPGGEEGVGGWGWGEGKFEGECGWKRSVKRVL